MGKCGSALTGIETDGVQAGDILRLVTSVSLLVLVKGKASNVKMTVLSLARKRTPHVAMKHWYLNTSMPGVTFQKTVFMRGFRFSQQCSTSIGVMIPEAV